MSGKSDLPFIMLVLPDRIPVFHVDLPDNRPVKETNDETFSFQLRVLFASKVIMTETFWIFTGQTSGEFVVHL